MNKQVASYCNVPGCRRHPGCREVNRRSDSWGLGKWLWWCLGVGIAGAVAFGLAIRVGMWIVRLFT